MKKITKIVNYIEIDEQEANILKELLNYCYHRADCHQTPISKFSKEIRQFRIDLEIIK